MIHVVLFAKHWTPGLGKTRLAARIGNDSAAHLAKLFLTVSLERFAGLGDQRFLAFAPPNQRMAFQELVAGTAWQLIEQSDGNLGERLRTMLSGRFQAGADRVLFLGADSPLVPTDYLTDAMGRLLSQDVVVGPATDGGYYTIGFSRDLPEVFVDIDWSTPRVMQQTVDRLNGLSPLQWSTLPMASDVDEYEDLAALGTVLQQQTECTPSMLLLAEQLAHVTQEAGTRDQAS